MIRVSAFVSAYNSANWLRGRIENLLAQTLWAQGALEIIVVDSGSRDETATILREYLSLGCNFKIITTKREGIYRAWNRAIRLASGQYVSNQNCDDRLSDIALEIFADMLDAHPNVGIMYADSIVTDSINATWQQHHVNTQPPYTRGRLAWGEFSLAKLRTACCIGPCPVWRKSLHEQLGYFDESYLLSGDYEYWLRAAVNGVEFYHIDDLLSLNYLGDNATPMNQEQSNMEARRALLRWR